MWLSGYEKRKEPVLTTTDERGRTHIVRRNRTRKATSA